MTQTQLTLQSIMDDLLSLNGDSSEGGAMTDKNVWDSTEEEQAFVILGKNAKDTIADLCAFPKLSNYKVEAGELINIVDTFYDTPDGLIREGKSSLRVRVANGQPFVTIKGKNQSKEGGSKRKELEVAWPWTGEGVPSPHDVTALFGMTVIQQRSTTRIARPIVRTFDNTVIAELAIDKVSYDFGKEAGAKTYEVEIEMKSNKGAPLSQLKKDLLKKFPSLHPWAQSKYAMGKVLEYAAAIQEDEDGYLTGSSFWALANLKT